jgi:transcription elongation factor GreA
MAEIKDILLTKEGLAKLEAELEYLKSVRREQVAERIKQAIAFGDISENAEYEDAKTEQAFIEGKIISLENTLKNARLMEEGDIRTDIVSLGSKVTLQEMKSGREVVVTLVSSVESKLKDGKISDESLAADPGIVNIGSIDKRWRQSPARCYRPPFPSLLYKYSSPGQGFGPAGNFLCSRHRSYKQKFQQMVDAQGGQ